MGAPQLQASKPLPDCPSASTPTITFTVVDNDFEQIFVDENAQLHVFVGGEICDRAWCFDAETAAFAAAIAPYCQMVEKFLTREPRARRITSDAFTDKAHTVHLHGHCFQKALADTGASVNALSLAKNCQVIDIPSGCSGMAASFGYEREHYELSMNIAELVLFPAVQEAEESAIIAAPGTSCRHQIHDGTGQRALHPVEVLWATLR